MITQQHIQPALKRIPAQYSFRPVAFYDRHSGSLSGTFNQGLLRQANPYADALGILQWAARQPAAIRPHTVYLTGGATAQDCPGRHWWRDPVASGGITITSWRTDPWRVEYEVGGVTVEIATAAPWFGAEHDALLCYRAFIALRGELKTRFDRAAELLTSPASTGADLLRRSLPVEEDRATGRWLSAVEYAPAPDELVAMLREHAGQGRTQCVAPAERQHTPALYVYDARWQYASCVAHLPIGPWLHDVDVPDLEPYRAGWYRVDATVPADWGGRLGLIGVRRDGRRVWPNADGERIQDAWVSSAELDVAATIAGWREICIKERWLAQPDSAAHADPGRKWARALRALREWSMQQEDDRDRLLAHAARHLLIDTVGYWWRPEREIARVAPPGQLPHGTALPADARGIVLLEDGSVEYRVPSPFGAMRAMLCRPEWAAMVWGRARAKTHKRALMAEPDHTDLLWVRSDALVTASPQPQWHDRGRVGDWRVKASIIAPWGNSFVIPRDETNYRHLWRSAAAMGATLGTAAPGYDPAGAAEGAEDENG